MSDSFSYGVVVIVGGILLAVAVVWRLYAKSQDDRIDVMIARAGGPLNLLEQRVLMEIDRRVKAVNDRLTIDIKNLADHILQQSDNRERALLEVIRGLKAERRRRGGGAEFDDDGDVPLGGE